VIRRFLIGRKEGGGREKGKRNINGNEREELIFYSRKREEIKKKYEPDFLLETGWF
jgi:hypothetical protein